MVIRGEIVTGRAPLRPQPPSVESQSLLTARRINVNVTYMKYERTDPARKRPYRMDRRAAAAQETGRRIIQATIDLYMERWLEDLTLEEVAERAGVTVQTVLRRFGSKSGLIQAAGETLRGEITAQRSQAPAGDIEGAVANLIEHYEATGDLTMRTLAQEQRHVVLRDFAEQGRAIHRAWVETAFAPFLDRRSPASRQDLLTRLVVVTDLYVWKLLRRDMNLEREKTEHEIVAMVSAVLERAR